MKRGTMSKKAFNAAAYWPNGEPKSIGPKCATCGDLAAWGTHPACERRRGKLIVWLPDSKAK
jgi:hypothetical protein